MSTEHDERRKHRRFTLSKRARLVLTPLREEADGQLIDLSLEGASITARWAVTAGVGVYLTFTVGGVLCEATGSVLRVFPFGDNFGLAVEFGVANGAFGDFLRRLEDAHEANRPDIMGEIVDLVIQIA